MESPKFLTKQNVLKLSFESGLIVLSVLLALFLNEYRSQLKDDRLTEQALMKVANELKTNTETVKGWLPHHKEILNNLQDALENDSIKTSLLNKSVVSFRSLMPRGIFERLINDSAWRALKSSNAFSNIDFDTMLSLSKVYNLQATGVESVLKVILETLASREALRKKDLEVTLLLLRNGFNELVLQEIFLIKNYEATLIEIRVASDLE